MYSNLEHFQDTLEQRIQQDFSCISEISIETMYKMISSSYVGFHIKIIDNKIKVVNEIDGYELRNKRLLEFLTFLTANYSIPNIEFVIHTEDYPPNNTLPLFVQSKKYNDHFGILYPDFSFYRWDWPAFPEASVDAWDDFRLDIKNYHIECEQKIPRCLFRGNNTNPIRKFIYNKTINDSFFDIDIGVTHNKRNQYIPLKEHAKYKYLLNLPGRSSSGRLKYLLLMRSIVFDVKGEYTEFWYHILQNDYHFFQFDNDDKLLSNIKEKIVTLEANKDYYINMVSQLKDIEEYFSMNSIIKYWLKLFEIYASKLTYEVVS